MDDAGSVFLHRRRGATTGSDQRGFAPIEFMIVVIRARKNGEKKGDN
jgi:hypothetical protein